MRNARPKSPGGEVSGAQTLDRGLVILEILAKRGGWVPLRDLTRETGIHRSAIYRLLRVLMKHRLVARDPGGGGYRLDVGITALGRGVDRGFGELARPLLTRLAEAVGATAFLSVADGEEAVAVMVVEPSRTAFHVAYREGFRHPLSRGAPGVAILAAREPKRDEPATAATARRKGYAISRGELQRGAIGIAAPVVIRGEACRASVGVVTLGDLNEREMGVRVTTIARSLAAEVTASRKALPVRSNRSDRS